jgi:flagellar basal body rod protein FlgC
VVEMTDLTSANRSYQANATVLNALKQMALRALDIGSR